MTRTGRPPGPAGQQEAEVLRERLVQARMKRSPASVFAKRQDVTFVRFIPDAFLKNPDTYQGVVGHVIDTETGCWLWTGSVVQKKYDMLDGEQVLTGGKPVVNLDGQSKSVRRELYIRNPKLQQHPPEGVPCAPYEGGVWPLKNTCGVAQCVNPEHCQEQVPTFLTEDEV